MPGTLDNLLRRIRDGQATAVERAEAQRLLAVDRRLPEDLRGVELEGPESQGEAAALLAVLGEDEGFGELLQRAIAAEGPGPAEVGPELEDPWAEDGWGPLGQALAEGLRAESDGVELAAAVADSLGFSPRVPVAPAVHAEAGTLSPEEIAVARPSIDVASAVQAEAGGVELLPSVLAALQVEVPPVASAVRAELGEPPELSHGVVSALGHEILDVAAAVRSEAGEAQVLPGVLESLGFSALPIAEAVRAEAGATPGIEGVAQVLAALEIPAHPVASAVRSEAGEVDLADRVAQTLAPEVLAGLLDHQLDTTTHRLAAEAVDADQRGRELTAMADLGRDLRAAVSAELGSGPSVWTEVALAIGIEEPERVEGWDEGWLAGAVLAEAGTVDVADAVMVEVRRPAPASMPLAEMPMHSLPPVANGRTWGLVGLLTAAVALFAALGGPWLSNPDLGAQGMSPLPMTFASAREVVVEELEYADGVQVFQTEGEGGALIIWFDDEGATL